MTVDAIASARERGADIVVLPELCLSGYMFDTMDEARSCAITPSIPSSPDGRGHWPGHRVWSWVVLQSDRVPDFTSAPPSWERRASRPSIGRPISGTGRSGSSPPAPRPLRSSTPPSVGWVC
ncbi:hypothetical protein GS415_06155 [Rhodococcus hoagii]|nr:hypothetical protein [Prescottella equi]